MQSIRAFRPHTESLEGKVVLSHVAAHAIPATAKIVHLDGNSTPIKDIGGTLTAGRPFYIRIVATHANALTLTIASPNGDHAKGRLTEGVVIDTSAPGFSDTIGEGLRHAHSIGELIRVTGQGQFNIHVRAALGPDIPPPGESLLHHNR